jgi:hypothetical protein
MSKRLTIVSLHFLLSWDKVDGKVKDCTGFSAYSSSETSLIDTECASKPEQNKNKEKQSLNIWSRNKINNIRFYL